MRLIAHPNACIYLILLLLASPFSTSAQVRVGAEQSSMFYPLLKGKRIGIIANNASVVRDENIVDILIKAGLNVSIIFSPEHGFRQSAGAGEVIGNSIDSATGIPVISLYGKSKRPSSTDLQSVDCMVFDIQDVGVRFYTYISTLSYVMEACAAGRIPLIVLDRPNPNGFYLDGPVLEKRFSSFVGLHPVPVVYGMTIGEYARMVNGEGWLEHQIKCNLVVIPLVNYSRQIRYALPVRPSPNLPNAEAVSLYPSLCFFEGTNISIGRGTTFPFQVYGHPDLTYGTFTFKPESIPGSSLHPPQEGKFCRGEDLRGFYSGFPGESGKLILQWLIKAHAAWKSDSAFFTPYFDKLAGNSMLRRQIMDGKTENEIRQSWSKGIERFRKIRERYLLYEP